MKGILPFSFCFFIFIGLWFQHHEFFKRYALQDKTTVWLERIDTKESVYDNIATVKRNRAEEVLSAP